MSIKSSPLRSTSAQNFVKLAVIVEGGLFFLGLFFCWLLGLDTTDLFEISADALWRDFGIALLSVLPLVGVLLLLTHATWKPIRRNRRLVNVVMTRSLSQLSRLEVLLICILAGLGEEFFFRICVQGGFWELGLWLGIPPEYASLVAIGLAGLLFGLAHAVTFVYFVFATFFGIFFGLLWSLTGSLLVPVIAHSVYDFIAVTYLVFLLRRRRH